MGCLPLVECHAFLPEGLSLGNSWNTTSSWDLNQASCSWPPSGDLTRHLQACAGGLGQIVPDPAFLFVVFLSSNDWRKWVNSAFRKTPLFKNCRCERLSLLYISKIEIYNPLSALLLTLVCHFYYVLLRNAIFVLNVAIATYFERRQKELSTKTLLWKIYRGKNVQFFTAQPLLLFFLPSFLELWFFLSFFSFPLCVCQECACAKSLIVHNQELDVTLPVPGVR